MLVHGVDVYFNKGVTEDEEIAVLDSPKFLTWLCLIEESYDVKSVIVHNVRMFGSKVGFIYAEAKATTFEGDFVPGITFIRGDSVAIIVVIKEEGTNNEYLAMVEEHRLPVAKKILAIPAGMVDDGSVTGASIKELKEELGEDLDFSLENLKPLGTSYSSPGGSDEAIHLYSYEMTLSSSKIEEIHGRIQRNQDENELIQVHVLPFNKETFIKTESMFSKLAMLNYKAEKTSFPF